MPSNILSLIADNPALFDAVRVLFAKQFEPPSDWKNIPASTDDKVLGQFMRARVAGLNAVDAACLEIASHKTIPDTPEQGNPGR